MKKAGFLAIAFILGTTLGTTLYGQESSGGKVTAGGFFLALGENILSNNLMYLANRYIMNEPWAQVSFASIRENFYEPWEWDRDEYFTNQFFHPYQGSVYHVAARTNGFNFYQSTLFAAFGSLSWETLCETNAPSFNDLICTTIGGAALGEMFHRLYFEIPNALAVLVSPVDAFNNLITGRRPQRGVRNIYSLKLASGIGYTYAGKSAEDEKGGGFSGSDARHMVSTDLACTVVYGDPFEQQSMTPYNHFEMAIYAGAGFPVWYNLKLLSDGYLFSFSAVDSENRHASTGLSLHYDLFADRQFNFFSQALDWTYKHKRRFSGGTDMEFKAHLGWTAFSADTFYVYDKYSNLRDTSNNYGTGINIKNTLAVRNPLWGAFELKAFMYEVFNIIQNENQDSGGDFYMYLAADYSYPVKKQTVAGIAVSSLWHRSFLDRLPDTRKWVPDVKLYIAFEM
ncbi:MAG: DUF3943 domain-containing protein [Treponema sp.]|nr:DUF3943 domain-containing protein [Treponema sp.]